MLLSRQLRYEVVLPAAYIGVTDELRRILEPARATVGLPDIDLRSGGSFWMRVAL
jgi:hypothetical protein